MAGDRLGSSKAIQVMIVGEAPGAQEDQRGIPFVGESGKILRTELTANGLIDKVYITNVVKCRPQAIELPPRKKSKRVDRTSTKRSHASNHNM